jgi:hypothetical protein
MSEDVKVPPEPQPEPEPIVCRGGLSLPKPGADDGE